MNDFPEEDLEETRAALAPTLDATAALLPWLSKPIAARFDRKLNQRWIFACKQLADAWATRYDNAERVRPAIFSLYAIALETSDSDCLHLGETLARAADQLEAGTPAAHLLAALSATTENLDEPSGLEHRAFAERLRHFTQRLEKALERDTGIGERSPVIDRLFVEDAFERTGLMQEALAALPPDTYAFKTEAAALAMQAEHLALYGIMHLAKELASHIDTADTEDLATRQKLQAMLAKLCETIAAVNP